MREPIAGSKIFALGSMKALDKCSIQRKKYEVHEFQGNSSRQNREICNKAFVLGNVKKTRTGFDH